MRRWCYCVSDSCEKSVFISAIAPSPLRKSGMAVMRVRERYNVNAIIVAFHLNAAFFSASSTAIIKSTYVAFGGMMSARIS
jgi:hypothetical protein